MDARIEQIQVDSLVLYKKRPARVVQLGDRLDLELEDGRRVKVRSKDVVLLHPGPLRSLDELRPLTGEVAAAWELLQEAGPFDLNDLAELIYGESTPASVWATWGHVEDGLYFSGPPVKVRARRPEEVRVTQRQRETAAAEALAWEGFLGRLATGWADPQQDARYLQELEDLALHRREGSRVLQALGRGERPEGAHALLLEVGFWPPTLNPYPTRNRLPLSSPEVELDPLPDEKRRDLTGLESYAIDDRDNRDPDDAVSLEGERLWVHVADAAARVPADSPADQEARARGATLYLPEGAVPMLPSQAVQSLGLGLEEISPALSFGLKLDPRGEIVDMEITPSWVRVQRTTYEGVEERLQEGPFQDLYRLARVYRDRRRANDALLIDMPEVILRVAEGRVEIRPVPPLRSREMVREAMLMAGEAAAHFAIQRGLPFPYTTQEPPDWERLEQGIPAPPPGVEDLASRIALFRILSRSQLRGSPAPHAGVGLSAYSRVTSPLRRYLDLVAHQQLRSALAGLPVLDESAMLERVGAAEEATRIVNQVEGLARRHWTLVYLLQNPDWQGAGVVVEKRGPRGRVIIPELALEQWMYLPEGLLLNSPLHLAVRDVDLPELEAFFEVLRSG